MQSHRAKKDGVALRYSTGQKDVRYERYFSVGKDCFVLAASTNQDKKPRSHETSTMNEKR